MQYKLSPLYQLIIDSRLGNDLPGTDHFAVLLTSVLDTIVGEFENEHMLNGSSDQFREFINDHYLSLISYQEKLYNIREPYRMLIASCINEIKDYLRKNFCGILDSYVPGNKV